MDSGDVGDFGDFGTVTVSARRRMILDGPDYPAPAKLNLFLHVVGRRADGYHLLQTLFRFLDHGDVLRFRPRSDGVISRMNVLDGVAPEDDLAIRAAIALQAATKTSLGADIEIDKRLPMGGGMGGGSSDAATALIVLNRLWQTGLSRQRLMEIGLHLGADVPVFVCGRSSLAEGVGEHLLAIELPPAWYVVLIPATAVSTREIFAAAELTRDTKAIKLAAFSADPERLTSLVNAGRNDLQAAATQRYPEIARQLGWLQQFGDARMTGSGASVFCAFASKPAADAVLAQALKEIPPKEMQGFVAAGVDRHPLYNSPGLK